MYYLYYIHFQLGQLCYGEARLDEALGFFLQDLLLSRSQLGLMHPRVAGILCDIALVYDDKNEKEAADLYKAALVILLEFYGPTHLQLASVR